MEKQTIALLLARGYVGQSLQPDTMVRYKALLRVNGRPLVDYVLRTLHESDAEKIFIVQGENEDLESVATKHQKNVFVTCNRASSSFASSISFGMEQIMEYYGLDEVHRKNIMVVPCDIPLARKESFNFLMQEKRKADSDVTAPIIESKYLKERFPERYFRSVYFKDMNRAYALQNIQLVSGEILNIREPASRVTGKLAISAWNNETMDELSRTVDRVAEHRHKVYLWPQLICETLRMLANGKHLLHATKVIYDLYGRQMTLEKARHYLYLLTSLRCEFVASKEVELSGDVDKPEDFEAIFGIQWQCVAEQNRATVIA